MTMLMPLLVLLWLPLLVADAVFVTEVLAGLRPKERRIPAGPRQRIALLVPAHDEEAGIGAAVRAMAAAAPEGTRILVVAHNCTDGTAGVAEAAGAEVLRLDQPGLRGKGHALAGGRDHLAADPPEVVIVIDADCVPEAGAPLLLADRVRSSGRAVQAAYLFRPQPEAAPVVQISSFAMLVKNLVRQRGARRISGPALLVGSGMAFPWALFRGLPLATSDLVEDLALGAELVRSGRPPLFEEHARVWSDPSSAGGTRTQRARWESGFLLTARRLALPLIGRGIATGRFKTLWLGLHLLTPPLTLLLLLNGIAFAGWSALLLAGAPPLAATLAGLVLLVVVGAVLAAWGRAGRAMLPGRVLARLPLYFLWKMGLYLRLVRGRETAAWIRTERVE